MAAHNEFIVNVKISVLNTIIQFALITLCLSRFACAASVESSVQTSEWDPYGRDVSQKCRDIADMARAEYVCKLFESCCKENLAYSECEITTSTCLPATYKMSAICVGKNCTEMTTTTTTTEMPQLNGANGQKCFMVDFLILWFPLAVCGMNVMFR